MTTYMKLTADITDEVMQKAEKELGETPETKKRALERMRFLINNKDGFCPVMEDWLLLIFLRSKKFNVEKAFKTLHMFYEFKSMYSGTITDLRPSQLKRILEMDAFVLSPFRNANGEGVVVFFLDAFDTENATPYDLLAASIAVAEIIILHEVSQICGTSLIYDLKNLSLRKLLHFAKPYLVSFLVKSLQDRWPYRVNSFHVINQPSYFNIWFDLVKIWLSKKLRDRIMIHGNNLDTLYDYFPKEILPKEIGGHLSEEIGEELRSYLYSKESIFDVLNKYTYNGVSCGKTNSNSDSS